MFRAARDSLNSIFFVGLQEVYDFSVKVFLHEINRNNETIEIVNERDQGNAKDLNKKKSAIKSNKALIAKAYRLNSYDVRLYKLGAHKINYPQLLTFVNFLTFLFTIIAVIKFCNTVKQYEYLWGELQIVGQRRKFSCPEII